MSFILEALKKVERKKGDDAQDGVFMQGGRRWGETRFPWALGGVVLVAIAALALASVALIRSFAGGDSGTAETPREPAAAMVEQASPSASAPVPVPLVEEDASAIPSSPDVAQGEGTVSGFPVEGGEEAQAETGETAPSEGNAGEPDATEEIEVAAAPPVTLVGRTSDAVAPPEAGDDAGEQPPSELPPLVLQGTSVIDGRPVAVVNYQRLFEGDFIEGARVVKIMDRVVELEFKGAHFTLRL